MGDFLGIGSAVQGATGLAGAAMQANAAEQAANLQYQASEQGLAQQQNQYNQTVKRLAPYNSVGQQALPGVYGAAADNPFLNQANGEAAAVNPTLGAAEGYTNNASAGMAAANSLYGAAASNTNNATNYIGQGVGEFGTAQNYLSGASSTLNGLTNGELSQANLEQTPGYQFTLNQGLESVQNSAAARGLGSSGAAMKAASNYATGLANNTYQQQYQDILSSASAQQGLGTSAAGIGSNLLNAGVAADTNTNALTGVGAGYENTAMGQDSTANALVGVGNQQTNLASLYGNLGQNYYTNLYNTASLGENAANQTGSLGQQAAQNETNLLAGGATAAASGLVGSADAMSGGLNGVGNALSNYALYSRILNGNNDNDGGFGGAGAGYASPWGN